MNGCIVVSAVIWRLYGQLWHRVYLFAGLYWPFAIAVVAFWGVNVVLGQAYLAIENQFQAGK